MQHTDGSVVVARWRQLCTPSNKCFLGPTPFSILNGISNRGAVSGRPFVKRFAICFRTVVALSCLSVLSVTLVCCGQTVGWIKMKFGTEVDLDAGHTVLDGDPALPKRSISPTFQPSPTDFP